MAKINKTDNTNAGENEEQLELCSEPLILIPNSSSFLCDEFFFLSFPPTSTQVHHTYLNLTVGQLSVLSPEHPCSCK